MSEHTYCDRCGMEITGERHCMGEGGTGPIFPWFHPNREVDQGATRSPKPYYDLVHAYAIESLHAALAEFSNSEVQL